ncbi:MAG: DUF4199 domain-containing protein [Bacteroidales bacterium]|nr:DUF4199 domain-containing protein [Bacteroidales bacterium]
MKSKNIWNYGFSWGSIIGGAYFFYHLIGYALSIETNFFWSFIGTFVIVFGMGWAMVNYRKNIIKDNMKFSKSFSIGAIMSIFISLFTTLFMVIYIGKLNPIYLDNFLVQYQDILDQMGSQIDVFEDPLILKTIKIVLFPSMFIFDYLGNIFYSLLVSLVVSRPLIGQPMPIHRPEKNDYVPYKDVKEEEMEKNEHGEDERGNDDVDEIGAVESSKGTYSKEDKETDNENKN